MPSRMLRIYFFEGLSRDPLQHSSEQGGTQACAPLSDWVLREAPREGCRIYHRSYMMVLLEGQMRGRILASYPEEQGAFVP
jgi:hypothetical protein